MRPPGWPRQADCSSGDLPMFRPPSRRRTLYRDSCRLLVVAIPVSTIVLLIVYSRLGVNSLFRPSPQPLPPSYTKGSKPDTRQLLASSLSTFLSHNQDLASRHWAPVSISACEPGTPSFFAPCLAQRREGALFGEELVYPDFRLREPVFAQSRSENAGEWRKLLPDIRGRAAWCEESGWVCYRGQTGQNIVLANATYTGVPADEWSDQACMGGDVSTAGLRTAPGHARVNTLETAAEYNEAFPIDNLLVAASPDSWSFQHFLDRVTHVVSQAAHLNLSHATPDVVLDARPRPVVAGMWEMLGFGGEKMHYYAGAPIAAKNIVFSCRSPLIHPWLSLRTLEMFGLDPVGIPLERRRKIVYISRSHGDMLNYGRRVLNEDELLPDIRALLVERGQGEDLVLFHELGLTSPRELMFWFHENVRAVVGPHGGGLYNHRWAGKDTLVLEMMPATHTSHMFWEEASVLGQTYANILLPPSSPGSKDMYADIPAVLDILREHLGKPDPRGPTVEPAYRWRAAELFEDGRR
ncbi:hypothetical protein BV20DRAFT_552485 [Pilatotrama ljubarskyi]|nr:hypothetical protein BV20DRAFT_552485 [Pilatotrama ljubarskyi]